MVLFNVLAAYFHFNISCATSEGATSHSASTVERLLLKSCTHLSAAASVYVSVFGIIFMHADLYISR